MQQGCYELCKNYDISEYDLKVDLTIKMTEASQWDPEPTCWDSSPLWGQVCKLFCCETSENEHVFVENRTNGFSISKCFLIK